jgi:hypothetical protein
MIWKLFKEPEELVRKDTPDSLVLERANRLKVWGWVSLALAIVSGLVTLWVGLNPIGGTVVLLYAGVGLLLIASDHTVTFDGQRQFVFFSTRSGPLVRNTKIIPFPEIASVYLDYEEHHYPHFGKNGQIERKWFIFLVLNNDQTATVAYYQAIYEIDQAPNLYKQTAAWEKLAQRICEITGKLLIRTPSVPSRTPHTFVGVIDQLVQRRLAALPPTDPLTKRTIRLRSHHNGHLEIVVDGAVYQELKEIGDVGVRDLVQTAIDEWQALNQRSFRVRTRPPAA